MRSREPTLEMCFGVDLDINCLQLLGGLSLFDVGKLSEVYKKCSKVTQLKCTRFLLVLKFLILKKGGTQFYVNFIS